MQAWKALKTLKVRFMSAACVTKFGALYLINTNSLPYITCHNSLALDKLTKNTCNYVKLAATVQY